MFFARGVALNVTAASVQLRVLRNSVYFSARLNLRGNNCTKAAWLFRKPAFSFRQAKDNEFGMASHDMKHILNVI
jgi:hypothetical protein